MEHEKIIQVLYDMDLKIVHNYNLGNNKVLLQIDPMLFNQLAEELGN